MNIKRNIIFTLESRKKDGVLIVENVPIRMRVNFASKRIEFTTGYRIDAAKWDTDKQRVRNGCTNKLKQSASEINSSLLGYYTEMQEIFKKFEVEEIMPIPEQIKEAFNDLHKPIEEVNPRKSKPNAFYKVFDEFVKDCGRQNDWAYSTYEKFATVKNHLMNFRDRLTFDFFDEKGLNDYVTYLRDVFLFQCFTGLRYSDVFNLRKSDIKGDHIEVTMIKTSDSLIIELNNHSKAILDKYKDVAFEDDKVLPVITNQKMNDYLKELAKLAGIDEPVRQTFYRGNECIDEVTPKYALLGTHAGRRTFICNALALGIPTQVVMKWTGHRITRP